MKPAAVAHAEISQREDRARTIGLDLVSQTVLGK